MENLTNLVQSLRHAKKTAYEEFQLTQGQLTGAKTGSPSEIPAKRHKAARDSIKAIDSIINTIVKIEHGILNLVKDTLAAYKKGSFGHGAQALSAALKHIDKATESLRVRLEREKSKMKDIRVTKYLKLFDAYAAGLRLAGRELFNEIVNLDEKQKSDFLERRNQRNQIVLGLKNENENEDLVSVSDESADMGSEAAENYNAGDYEAEAYEDQDEISFPAGYEGYAGFIPRGGPSHQPFPSLVDLHALNREVDFAALRAEIREQRTRIQALESTLVDYENDRSLSGVKPIPSAMNSELSHAIVRLGDSTVELRTRTTELRDTSRQHDQRIGQLSQDIDGQNAHLGEISAAVERQNDRLTAMDITVQAYSRSTDAIGDDVREQNERLVAMNDAVQRYSRSTDELGDEVRGQNERLDAMESMIQKQGRSLGALSAVTLGKINAITQRQDERFDAVNSTLDNMQSTVQQHGQSIGGIKSQIQKVEMTVQKQNTILNDIHLTLSRVTNKVVHQEKNVDTLEQRHADRINALEAEVKALRELILQERLQAQQAKQIAEATAASVGPMLNQFPIVQQNAANAVQQSAAAIQQAATAVQQAGAAVQLSSDEHIKAVMAPVLNARR